MSHPVTLSDWLRALETRHPVTIDLGLDRIAAVWECMGAPRPGTRVVTVAGTNGKGSTVAYVAALLRGCGRTVGTYTSPHLLRYNERVEIGGRPVSDEALVGAFEQVEAARGEISLTYFEFGTLAAFVLLAEAGPDVAVLEVGLGGRLDAVNVIDADCAVITPLGLDHQEYLGPDRESIGREKAGIIRPGRPVICGEPAPPASVLAVAAACGAPVWRLGHEFTIEPTATGLRWCGGGGAVDLPPAPMAGAHQADNLATAVAAVSRLVPDLPARAGSLASALSGVSVPGRLQQVLDRPRVLIDVGHNALAARVVASALRSAGQRADRCVLGMLADKDAGAAVRELCGVVGAWHCCSLGGERGRSAADLARVVAPVAAGSPVSEYDDVATGLERAVTLSGEGDTVLVFGSFHTAAAAAKWAETRGPAPAHAG